MRTVDEKHCILASAAAQGLGLLLLHELSAWLQEPTNYFWLLWPLYVIVFWLPLSVQLLAQHCRKSISWRIFGWFAAALAAMAAYKGWSIGVSGSSTDSWNTDAFVFALTAATLWFVLLPFAQLRLQRGVWRPDYPLLFAAAWRNLLQLASAALFSGVFWLLLGLWAGLFSMLGVKFFADLFSIRLFAYPACSVSFGLGLILYRERETMIQGIYGALLQIMGWLLPLAALLAVCFLAALPFTGLQPLWKTGHAGALLLMLQGFLLLLFNAAWQDGSGEPLPPNWLRRPLAWTMALLPLYAGLNTYSLSLRVAQYGWSDERVWAALLIIICCFYGLGYAYAALRRSDKWMGGVAQVNIAGALLLCALLAATATPLLDPVRISVASQVERLLSGKVSVDTFDYRYLRFDTGRYGTAALQRLSVLEGYPQAAEIRIKARDIQAQKNRYGEAADSWTPEKIAAKLAVYPTGATTDASFLRFLAAKIKAEPWSCTCLQQNGRCLLLVVDLNGDGKAEHILLNYVSRGEVFQRDGETWLRAGEIVIGSGEADNIEDLQRDLAQSKLQLRVPEWRDVEIGKRHYRISR